MNEYERRREERIARNRAVLERLIASDPAHAALHAGTSKTTSRATPRVDSKLKKKTARRVDASDLRRSGRVRKLPAPVYTTFDVDDNLGDANATRKRVKKRHGGGEKAERTAERELSPRARCETVGRVRELFRFTDFTASERRRSEGGGRARAQSGGESKV